MAGAARECTHTACPWPAKPRQVGRLPGSSLVQCLTSLSAAQFSLLYSWGMRLQIWVSLGLCSALSSWYRTRRLLKSTLRRPCSASLAGCLNTQAEQGRSGRGTSLNRWLHIMVQ